MQLRSMPYDAGTYLHLERYVNEGSPSGFTDTHTTSAETSPKGGREKFFLSAAEFPESVSVRDFGNPPDCIRPWQMLVHPDMIGESLFTSASRIIDEALSVSPTASARTVRIADEAGWLLKLNYKGLIGRFNRQIGIPQAQAATEVSRVISAAIDGNSLPNSFYFLREVFGRVVALPDEHSVYEWGMVVREPTPYPHSENGSMMVPAFSLFSRDDKAPTDATLLVQLIADQSKSAEDFVFEDLVAPLFDSYFTLLLRCGLQLEAHAQNMLFLLSAARRPVGVVARDAESIDRDLSLMQDLGIPNQFKLSDWKFLSRDQYNYQIMHSFMFDFKFGEYLVKPIIAEAALHFDLDVKRLRDRIRDHNRNYISLLPPDFFPADGCWYSYANIVHDRSKPRPYIATPDPRFRYAHV